MNLTTTFLKYFVHGTARIPSFAECMRSKYGVGGNEGVFNGNEFFRTDYYNMIFRPQDIHIPLHAAIRDRGGRALGRCWHTGHREIDATPHRR